MKKLLSLALVVLLALSLFACTKAPAATTPTPEPPATATPAPTPEPTPAPTPDPTPEPTPTPEPPVELIVFAAASMTETLTAIADLYKTVAPNVTLTFTFDSSGTLLTQIKEGADCDVFISAAQKQINALDVTASETANPDKTDLLLAGSRFNLVENKVALVVPDGNPANILTFDDAIAAKSIALGNSDVPVGQYSEEIFTNLGVWDEAFQKKVSFGSNVKEVTSWVTEGAVDCGIVYATDAFSAGLTIVASAPEGSLKTPVVYPAAALNISKSPTAALAFLDYLKTPAAADVFRSVGFEIAS
jgi:molybdate transport system substrate-binding protein